MEILIFWLVFCGVAAAIAGNKGRSPVGFFFLSVFLSPLLGVIIALVVKPNERIVEKIKLGKGDGKRCPFCAELIKSEATVCRFCGRDMPMRSAMVGGGRSLPSSDFRARALPSAREQLKEFYLSIGGEQTGPYSLTQIQEMWNRGDLNEDAIYWKEGAPEWRPILEII